MNCSSSFFQKNGSITCTVHKIGITLQLQIKIGRLDEWFSHRSAKPGTAVRIR